MNILLQSIFNQTTSFGCPKTKDVKQQILILNKEDSISYWMPFLLSHISLFGVPITLCEYF